VGDGCTVGLGVGVGVLVGDGCFVGLDVGLPACDDPV
jgi:hypothetical protein